MRTPVVTKLAAQLGVRTPKLRVNRSFARTPRRSARSCAWIKLPRELWDRIVLLVFTCCLFVFLHALFGFGLVDGGLRGSSDTFVHPRILPVISASWKWGAETSSENQKVRAISMTRVIVDWHGNYELLPSTPSALVSPATIPKDAFPDPTPTQVRAERGGVADGGSRSTITRVGTPVDIQSTFYGALYDPFRLIFEDPIDEDESHRVYPATELPRTARHFGRCLPGEACL